MPRVIFCMFKSKQDIIEALEKNDVETVAAFAMGDKKVISLLIRIAYDKETLAGWRAIKAIGIAARELIKTDCEFLRETVRKLLWSLTDESGGIGWSAPELLGEIVSADPRRFSDIIPLIAQVYDIEEEVFRPGVVYALARIAETSPEQVAVYQRIITMSLVDKNPLLKIYGLELVERLWQPVVHKNLWSPEYRRNIRNLIESISTSTKVAWVYKIDDFIECEVGYVSKKTLKNIMMNNK